MPVSTTIDLDLIKAKCSPSHLLREKQVLGLFPISRATWWRGVKAGTYPKPIKLSERTTAWRSEDIYALIERVSEGVAKA